MSVINIRSEEEVKKGLIKQDCTVGEATGTARISLWEENDGILAEDQARTCEYQIIQGAKISINPQGWL